MKMKQKKLIIYKSIFKYTDHKETLSYQEIGEYTKNETGLKITFKTEEIKIDIRIRGNTVWLTNNQSTLQLQLHKRVKSDYHTPYGNIVMETYLETLEATDNIKLKYTLYDGLEKLNEVYLLVQTKTLEN